MAATTPRGSSPTRPAPHQSSTIAPYRWHVINNIATKLGWLWEQESNTVDQFSRNGVVLTVSWASREMAEAVGTDGLAIRSRDKFKLQKLCRALGADIRDDQTFASVPAGNIAKLPNMGVLEAGAISGLRAFGEQTPDVSSAATSPTVDPAGAGEVDALDRDRRRWNIPLGQDNERGSIEAARGGDHRYRGIVPLTTNVVIYSDHKKASGSGYDFDGWDAKRELFYYTGEGANGNQEFKGGNNAIRYHREENRLLRLFVAVRNAESGSARVHRYVGEFEVDANVPYVVRRAPGRDDRIPRNVIVFRLRPLGQVITDVAQISIIEGAVAASSIEAVSVEAVPEAAVKAERAEFERIIRGEIEQKEAALTTRFREYLEKSHGREVRRYKITTPSGLLFTDTADVTAGVLYEAKGTEERVSVRLALGQVLDYGRYVKDADLAVLLPDTPASDLVELLESHNVGCVVEGELGQFSDMTGLKRCPAIPERG